MQDHMAKKVGAITPCCVCHPFSGQGFVMYRDICFRKNGHSASLHSVLNPIQREIRQGWRKLAALRDLNFGDLDLGS